MDRAALSSALEMMTSGAAQFASGVAQASAELAKLPNEPLAQVMSHLDTKESGMTGVTTQLKQLNAKVDVLQATTATLQATVERNDVNHIRRARNARALPNTPLAWLKNARGEEPPTSFPTSADDVNDVALADIDLILDFYGLQFEGDVTDKRIEVLRHIGQRV